MYKLIDSFFIRMPNIKRVGAIVLSIANTLNTQLEVKQVRHRY